MVSIISSILREYDTYRINDFFEKMFEVEKIHLPVYFVILQESVHAEVRELGFVKASRLSQNQIFNNLGLLLESRSLKSPSARSLADGLLRSLSSEKLLQKFSLLIYYLRSECVFVRSQAELLIDSIDTRLLFGELIFLSHLRSDCNCNVRRVAETLVTKIKERN